MRKQRRRSALRAFVFATRIVHSLYYLNPKFQASKHLLWLYSPVCVGPGRKPRRTVFSQRGSFLAQLSRRLIGELIVYPWSGVRRTSSVRPSVVHNAKTSSSQKPLDRSKPNFMWSLLGLGEQNFVRGIWVT